MDATFDNIPLDALDAAPDLDYDIADVGDRINEIMDGLMTLWSAKAAEYGVDRYDDRHAPDFNAWMCYSDVYRKHLRLETLTRRLANGDVTALPALRDAYADIALYAVSALAVLPEA